MAVTFGATTRPIILGIVGDSAASPADLGQYSDSQVRHSHPLALTQLFLVYHLLRARQRDEIEV